MASNVPGARDAELAHLSGAELVHHLRTTSRNTDYEAVERVLSAREGRAAEAEAQLKAALTENDVMRKEQDARRRAQLAGESEEAAHLGRIVAVAEAHLKVALAEIDALRKKHDAPRRAPQDVAEVTPTLRKKHDAPRRAPQDVAEVTPTLRIASPAALPQDVAEVTPTLQKKHDAPRRAPQDKAEVTPTLRIASPAALPQDEAVPTPMQQIYSPASVPQDEAVPTPLLPIDAPAKVPKDEAETAFLLLRMASSPVHALAALPHDEAEETPLLGITSSPVLTPAAVPHAEAEETPSLGITAPAPVPQDEKRVVDWEERDENGVERIVLSSDDEEEGPRSEGSGVSLKSKANAHEDLEDEEDTIPLSQRFKRLRETMAPPRGSSLRINASPGIAMSSQVRSASVTGSKRGQSVEACDKMRKARTDSQGKGNKTRAAGNSLRNREVGARGRGRGRGTRKTSDKPVPSGWHSNFRCWLELPASSSRQTFVGGNPGASVTVKAPAVVSLEENRMPSFPPLSIRNISGADLRNMSHKPDKAVANGQQLQSTSSDNGLHVNEVNTTMVGELGQKQQDGDGKEGTLAH